MLKTSVCIVLICGWSVGVLSHQTAATNNNNTQQPTTTTKNQQQRTTTTINHQRPTSTTDNNQQHPITIRNNNTQQHITPHTAAQDHTGPHSARHACQCSAGRHDAACCSGPCGAEGVSPCGGPHVPPRGRTAGGGENLIYEQEWKSPKAREAARAFWASRPTIPTHFSTDLHATLLSVAWKDLEAGFTPRKAAPPSPSDSALWHMSVKRQHTQKKNLNSPLRQIAGSAQADEMTHCSFLKLCKPNFSMTFAVVTALSKSCLLAENHHHCIAHLVLIQHFDEFFVCLLNPVSVIAVNGADQTVYSPVVLAPSRLNPVLASRAPHSETQVLVLNDLHFATDLRNGSHHLDKFQLVDNRGSSCGIKLDHQNPASVLPTKRSQVWVKTKPMATNTP